MNALVTSKRLKEIGREVNAMTEQTIYEKLSLIQRELKAPKNQYNDFGKYNYRNCEDILEAVKPLCNKNRTTLVLGDEAVSIDGWHYIKATARIIDWDSNKVIECSAYARECQSKKGMDDGQITGSTSSYARKYALNGLFNIDDSKDSDTPELKKEADAKKKYADKTSNANPKAEDVSGAMLTEFKNCQNKLAALGVDIRSENIKQWMADHTGYADQNADIQDPIKMKKLIDAYKTLIAGKEKKAQEQANANANQA